MGGAWGGRGGPRRAKRSDPRAHAQQRSAGTPGRAAGAESAGPVLSQACGAAPRMGPRALHHRSTHAFPIQETHLHPLKGARKEGDGSRTSKSSELTKLFTVSQ